MEEDRLDPELERMMRGIKPKEPSEQDMSDFLSGVHKKIEVGPGGFPIGFAQLSVGLIAALAVGCLLVYILLPARAPKPADIPETPERDIQVAEPASSAVPASAAFEPAVRESEEVLSIEEELAILEALNEEFSDEWVDLWSDEDVLDELVLLDDYEMSLIESATVGGV